MKIGNFEFNVDAMSNVTREEFVKKYHGWLKADINYAADLLDRYFKKEEKVVQEVVQEKPKRRRKRK